MTAANESTSEKKRRDFPAVKIALLVTITVLLGIGIIVGVLILFQTRKDDSGARIESSSIVAIDNAGAEIMGESSELTEWVPDSSVDVSESRQDNDAVVQTNITAYRIVSTKGSNNAAGRTFAQADSRSSVTGYLHEGDIVYISAYSTGKYYHWGKCDDGWIALSANNTESTTAETYAVVSDGNYESLTKAFSPIVTAYRIVSAKGANNAAGRIFAQADSRSSVTGYLHEGDIVYISAYTVGKYYHWGKCDGGWIALSANSTESTAAETYAVVDGVNSESLTQPSFPTTEPTTAFEDQLALTELVVERFSYKKGSTEYHVPEINLSGEVFDSINKEIESDYYDVAVSQKSVLEKGSSPDILSINYDWKVVGNMLSLHVYYNIYAGSSRHNVYNLDIRSGRYYSNSEIANLFGISEEEFYSAAKEAMENKFYDEYGTEPFSSDYADTWERMRSNTISESNVRKVTPYINNNGKLCIVATIYSMGGAGLYDRTIELSGLDIIDG